MRKLVFGLSLGLVSSSFAVQLEGNYLNLNGGAALQPNITYHATDNSAANGNRYLATESKRGGALDLSYGYQTEDLRAEISAIYLENKIKKSLMRSTYFDITGAPNMGGTKVVGLMANGMYDFDSEADFTPYIGFGIGGVRISHNIKAFPSFDATINTNIHTTIVPTPMAPVVTTTTDNSTDPATVTTTTTTPASTTDTTTVTTTSTVTPGSLPSGVVLINSGVSPIVETSTAPIQTPTPTAPNDTNSILSGPFASYSNGTQVQFAYQTIIGVSYKVMDELKLSADYRYLRALASTFKVMDAGVRDVPMKGSYSNHRLMFGLTAFFKNIF